MKLSFRMTLLSLAVTASFAPMLAAPAINLLPMAFPDVDPLLIQWVITLSSIFILPTLFAVPYLSERFSKKTILVTGLIFYLIGGIGPSFVDSMTWILAFRAILGLSIGLISPTFNSLIAEYFQGEARARMNGLVTAVNGIGGAIFLSIGGFIAAFGWRSVFLTYLYAVVLLALVIFFIPNISSAEKRSRTTGTGLPRAFYVIALLSGLHVMLYFTIPTSFPLFLAESGIGTVRTVGYLSALSLLSIFIAGLAFPFLMRLLKDAFVTVGMLLYGLGFLLVAMAQSVWAVFAAVILIGLGQGLFFPMSFSKTAAAVPGERVTQAITFLLASIYLFQFICPVFMNVVPKLFAFSSSRQTFLFLAAAMGASILVSLVLIVRKSSGQKAAV